MDKKELGNTAVCMERKELDTPTFGLPRDSVIF